MDAMLEMMRRNGVPPSPIVNHPGALPEHLVPAWQAFVELSGLEDGIRPSDVAAYADSIELPRADRAAVLRHVLALDAERRKWVADKVRAERDAAGGRS